MNILITGIHGFVGTNLLHALKSDHTIYGLDIVSFPKEGLVQTYSWAELEALPPIDAVIHLAGKAHDTKNQTNAQTYFDINTGLTQKIYDWFLKSSASKFIFFSSVKAAADKVDGVLTEDVVPVPIGPYGESKIAAEKYILELQPRAESLGKHTYILRPCMIHGPGNKGNFNLLFSFVNKGVPYPLGTFDNKRSYTSIDNLSYVISQMIVKEIPSGIYNMADDESLSTNALISLMCKTMDKPNRIWNWNKLIVRSVAKIGTVLHLPLNSERLNKLTENYLVSNKKLKHALEISKMPLTAEEGFVKTIKSFSRR